MEMADPARQMMAARRACDTDARSAEAESDRTMSACTAEGFADVGLGLSFVRSGG